MQIFENKNEITTIIKELRTCFDKINQQFMLWILETTKLKTHTHTHTHIIIITIRETLRKKRVIRNNLLLGALLLLERMF